MIATVAVTELALARVTKNYLRFEQWDWKLARQAAADQALSCEVLCFGDSLVKYGVHPRVLERRLGKRSHNLAVCGGTAASTYYLFRRALESRARPTAVVVDFAPSFLAKNPADTTTLLPWWQLLSTRDALDLALTTNRPGCLPPLLLQCWLPSLGGREFLRAGVKTKLTGVPNRVLPVSREHIFNWQNNLGAQLTSKSPRASLARPPDEELALRGPWMCHAANEDYVRRFMELAASDGVAVIWLLPPAQTQVREAYDRAGYTLRQASFARGFQRRFPGLIVVDAQYADFPYTVFVDSAHLDRDGAMVLSEGLAEILATRPTGTSSVRWHSLPPYRMIFDRTGIIVPSLAERRPARRRG
jgi:hypothetical protein